MRGLMQNWPMTLDRILDHAKVAHGEQVVVTRSVEGPIVRCTYADIHRRAKQFSRALLELGVIPGDRIATLATNTGRHLEAWYGIMGIGAICHTLNPRLFKDQLCRIIREAEDRIILTDVTYLPVLLERWSDLPTVEHIVVLADDDALGAHAGSGALSYEALLRSHEAVCDWGGFDENTAAGLCYTSGTTGGPKGVLYSHRSNFLHTLMVLGADVFALTARDTVLPIVPMYHANTWGLAFAAPATGAKLVMPGAKLDGSSLYELIESEQVTFSAGVPTVWQALLTFMRDCGLRFSSLKRVVIGGAAAPEGMIRALHDHGVDVAHAWGMTETSPVAAVCRPTAASVAQGEASQIGFAVKQGRAPLGIEFKLVNEDDQPVPRDGRTFGRLKVKGPWVADRYFRKENDAVLDAEGFFDTGDVATIDPLGFMQITDRAKDLVKSGGEWISSVEIENIAMGHSSVALAAVIGVPHPKWDERPILLIKLRDQVTCTKAEFLALLEDKIAKWWMPDEVLFVDDIPLGPTGKTDKKRLRELMKDFTLPG